MCDEKDIEEFYKPKIQYKIIECPTLVKRTENPIRKIVNYMKPPKIKDKPLISLSIGDPTLHGNFLPPAEAEEYFKEIISTHQSNGYPNSSGDPTVREIIATKYSNDYSRLISNDIILTTGCSQAISLALDSLLETEKDNIYIPNPGFPLYKSLCTSKKINYKLYNLLPNNNWEIDLVSLEKQLQNDKQAKVILINTPSNPTGSIFSKEHIIDIITLCEKYSLIIISDEIYANLQYPNYNCIQIASLSKNVPIIETNGISKLYMTPGWRLGYIIVHNRNNILDNVISGMHILSQLLLGPCSLIQKVCGYMLQNVREGYYENNRIKIEMNMNICYNLLSSVNGIHIKKSTAAMYMMCEIDCTILNFDDDIQFSNQLLDEEAVFVLPGQCFGIDNFIRLVITPPPELLTEACERIRNFCIRHVRKV